MKKLFFLWLLFFNGEAFSQQRKDSVVAEVDFGRQPAWMGSLTTGVVVYPADTVRAILLVTHDGHGTMSVAFSKSGFVVLRNLREPIYLDDRKVVIKAPFTVWSYKVKK